jgi:hypothetical protein
MSQHETPPHRTPASRWWAAFIIVLVIVVALELLVGRTTHFGIDGLFAFEAWYGFLSCVGLIVIAKLLGVLLKRRDTYYDS